MRTDFKILIVDDNPRIQSDFEKILVSKKQEDDLDILKDELFGGGSKTKEENVRNYKLSCHSSGESSVVEIKRSIDDNDRYALAFVDIRMPGWDGIQTAQEIWKLDPDVQIVLCTAYTDYTWEDILETLGGEHSFLILKKPFDIIEVKQIAHMLTSKWDLLLKERKSMKGLSDALKAKDEFLARVSHEVRTPLHGIVGIVDLLKETKLGDQQIDFVQTLASCAESLGQIIDDILDFSAIEDGRFALKPIDFSFHEFMKGVQKQYQFDSFSRGIDLVFDVDSNVPKWMKGDTTRLTQVLGNILRNAFKFTPDGEISVKCKCTDRLANGYRLDFEIKDSGVGIPAQFMENLFVPFSQAENVDRRRFGGTGLGLAISKGLIESMEGQIRVSSEVGMGTTVAFDLVLEKGLAPVKVPEIEEVVRDKKKNHYRILAVDDSSTNRKVIKNQLFWLGYECEVVSGCEEAIVALGKRDYDLVLMDCQMPDIDGFEATSKIREIYPEYEQIPIVALSANIDKSTQEKCRSVGMDAFVSKPAKKNEIDQVVCKMIEKGRESGVNV